ncbi:MAG: hypothetical protein ACI8TQ_003106 [Planctomycetota bacterium]|jgi:hypothetical protein
MNFQISLIWSKQAILGLGLAALCTASAGCAGFEARALMPKYQEKFYAGDMAGAQAVLDGALSNGEGEEEAGDRPMYLMERGLIHQRARNFAAAGTDFQVADEQLEVSDFDSKALENIGEFALNANTAKYRGMPHEKILLNSLNILNYLQQGDFNSMKIAARRAATQDDFQTEVEGHYDFKSALTPLLYGLAFEASNETKQAHVAYKTAFESCGADFLKPRLLAIAKEHGFSDRQRWMNEFGDLDAPVADGQGSVLVVVMNGQAPVRKDQEHILGPTNLEYAHDGASMAALGRNSVIVPYLKSRSHLYSSGTATVDGSTGDLVQVVDIETQAIARFEDELPQIVAATVVRYLVRHGAEALAEEHGDEDLANIVKIFSFVAEALDLPDIRCWSLLPAEIMVSIQSAPAGANEVSIQMNGTGSKTMQQTVQVEEGGIAVAMFFVTE